jgi:hypothetical protein
MNRPSKRLTRPGVVAAITALSALSIAAPASAGPDSLTDPVGDTADSDSGALLPTATADIVASSVSSGPGGIRLAVNVVKFADPLADTRWASESTYINWDLDTTGDGKADYFVEYFRDGEKLDGDVAQVTAADVLPPLCELTSISYSEDEGYIAVFPAKCIGSPTSLAYQVGLYWDTDPKNEEAAQVADLAPDKGMTPAIALNAAPPVRQGPTTQKGVEAAPTTTLPVAAAPAVAPVAAAPVAAPAPKAPAAALKVAPKPAAPKAAAPKAAASVATARPKAVGPAAPSQPAAAAGAPDPALARTGPREAKLLTVLAGGLLSLAGICRIGGAGLRRGPVS